MAFRPSNIFSILLNLYVRAHVFVCAWMVFALIHRRTANMATAKMWFILFISVYSCYLIWKTWDILCSCTANDFVSLLYIEMCVCVYDGFEWFIYKLCGICFCWPIACLRFIYIIAVFLALKCFMPNIRILWFTINSFDGWICGCVYGRWPKAKWLLMMN